MNDVLKDYDIEIEKRGGIRYLSLPNGLQFPICLYRDYSVVYGLPELDITLSPEELAALKRYEADSSVHIVEGPSVNEEQSFTTADPKTFITYARMGLNTLWTGGGEPPDIPEG